MRGERELNMP